MTFKAKALRAVEANAMDRMRMAQGGETLGADIIRATSVVAMDLAAALAQDLERLAEMVTNDD